MPEVEIRIFDHDRLLDEPFAAALQGLRPDIVSLGSESCYRQLPELAALDAILERLAPYRTKFVVPMLFESHFERVLPVIEKVVGRVDTVVVNDYGVLHFLRERHARSLSRVSLGSGLSYSYEECPWNNHIVRDEPAAVRNATLRSNFDNDWMYEFLEMFPFSFEVEIPALPGMMASAEGLRRHGLRVAALARGIPVSIARACHAARYFQRAVDDCGRVCRTAALLDPTHRWDFFEGDVKEIRREIKQQMPRFMGWGNMIYVDAPARAEILAAADTAIFDLRFFPSPEQLRDGVAAVREAAPAARDRPVQPRLRGGAPA